MNAHPPEDDILLYLCGELERFRKKMVRDHLSRCDSCLERLTEDFRFPFNFQRFSLSSSIDRRKERRFATNGAAKVRLLLDPVSNDVVDVRILDVSRSGMRLCVPKRLMQGAPLMIRSGKNVAFGRVRHCTVERGEIIVGVQIDDVIPVPRSRPRTEADPVEASPAANSPDPSQTR